MSTKSWERSNNKTSINHLVNRKKSTKRQINYEDLFLAINSIVLKILKVQSCELVVDIRKNNVINENGFLTFSNQNCAESKTLLTERILVNFNKV